MLNSFKSRVINLTVLDTVVTAEFEIFARIELLHLAMTGSAATHRGAIHRTQTASFSVAPSVLLRAFIVASKRA
jgi:hypothetical protein